jgi:threonine dehydrogenase-like Zn-dependent dehydrogenase
MRAIIMYRAGDVRIENVPDARLIEPTDALITITRACICGSDLWPYKELTPSETGRRMGHEAIGVIQGVGREVRRLKVGDLVVMPFAYSDGTCDFCHDGLPTSCVRGGFFGVGGPADGAQAEALRVPQAEGTLFALPVGRDDALMPSLLTLSDVMGTGHHAAVSAKVRRGKAAAIIGDGAVGLCGAIAAKRLGAEHIIMLGRHPDRIAIARKFGATHIVSERGGEAVEHVRKLTGGFGAHSVLECVGSEDAMRTGTCRGASLPGDSSNRRGHVFQERHCKWRSRTGPRLHPGVAARHPRGPHRAWLGLRPPNRSGRSTRWVSGNG